MNPRLQQVGMDLLEEFPVETVVDEALAEVRAEIPAFHAIDPDRLREDVTGALALAREVMLKGVDEGGLESDALRTDRGHARRAGRGARRGAERLPDRGTHRRRRCPRPRPRARGRLTGDPRADPGGLGALRRRRRRALRGAPLLHRRPRPQATRRRPREPPLRRLVHGDLGEAAVWRPPAPTWASTPTTPIVVVVAGGDGAVDGRLVASYSDPTVDRVVGLATLPPLEPWGVPVGYGDQAKPGDLPLSFRGAVDAWELAGAFGVGGAAARRRRAAAAGRYASCLRSATGSSSAAWATSTRPAVRRPGRRCAPGSPPRAARTRPRTPCSCTGTRCATGCGRSPRRPGSRSTGPRTRSWCGGRCGTSTRWTGAAEQQQAGPIRLPSRGEPPVAQITRSADHSVRSKGPAMSETSRRRFIGVTGAGPRPSVPPPSYPAPPGPGQAHLREDSAKSPVVAYVSDIDLGRGDPPGRRARGRRPRPRPRRPASSTRQGG